MMEVCDDKNRTTDVGGRHTQTAALARSATGRAPRGSRAVLGGDSARTQPVVATVLVCCNRRSSCSASAGVRQSGRIRARSTLRNWEQGRRTPDGPALALLRVAARDPQAVVAALHGAGVGARAAADRSVLVTIDNDFGERAVVRGRPPPNGAFQVALPARATAPS